MKRSAKLLTILCAGALCAGLLTACGGSDSAPASSDKAVTIKVGASPSPHAEILNAVKDQLAKEGVNLQVVEFNDYVQPNLALNDGSLDANYFQHQPYLDEFNKDRGLDLVSLGGVHIEPMSVYSNKVKDIKDLKDGALIAIPNDPTNGGRGLALLAKAGLITLKEGVGFKATVADITSNPKNLQIQELEAAQLPRSLDDVAVAAIPMNYVQSAGLNVEKQGFFLEPKDEPLAVMILAVRSQDKDNETYKKIADIYKSEAIKKFIDETFKGSITSAN